MDFFRRLISAISAFVHFVIPPREWRFVVIVLLGIFAGLGFYTLRISNAVSYLSDQPETCMNCHVMSPEYATWAHGSHRQRAVCTDCHVPHDNVIHKYFFKAKDGLRHATIFTMRTEPQVIVMKPDGVTAVQENCIRCHANLLDGVSARDVTGKNYLHGEGKLCWDCHRETPHGTVRSLSSVPYARVPQLPSVIPSWLDEFLRKSQNIK